MDTSKKKQENKYVLVKKWMESHIGEYQRDERKKFFADCQTELQANSRVIQRAYSETFKPVCNLRNPDIIEDNRKTQTTEQPVQTDKELILENMKLRKDAQKLDAQVSLLERERNLYVKSSASQESFFAALATNFSKLYGTSGKLEKRDIPLVSPGGYVGIFQLSDLHLNEEINIAGNEYSFEIASARLYKYVRAAKHLFKSYNVRRILVAMTGDFVNSDRRPDEYLSNTYSRADALCLAVDLLRQVIDSLSQDFTVSVCSVAGNESRIPKDWGWTDKVAGDNYDCIIFKMLSMIHASTPNVNYIFGNIVEELIQVNGANIIFTHGFKAGGSPDAFAADVRSRFAAKNKLIHYVISGHKHVSSIGDFHGVSGSLSGSNAYGEFDLNKSCRASQNLYLVAGNKEITGVRIDLQNLDSTAPEDRFVLDNVTGNGDINTIDLHI